MAFLFPSAEIFLYCGKPLVNADASFLGFLVQKKPILRPYGGQVRRASLFRREVPIEDLPCIRAYARLLGRLDRRLGARH